MMVRRPRLARRWHALAPVLALVGCAATTSSQLVPAPQAPVCQRGAAARVLWTVQWRADQKDVADREAAAAQGLQRFFAGASCFDAVSLRRLPAGAGLGPDDFAEAAARREPLVLIVVRELGPTVKLGASLVLVEGATEVVLDITAQSPAASAPRSFTVRWRNGGPGVLKGVATLPEDMQAALAAGLQTHAARD